MFFDKEGNKRLTRRDEICEYPEFLSNIQNYHVAGHKLVLRISPWASGDERDEAGLLFRIKTFTERRLALQALKQSNNSWNLVSLQFHIEIKDYKRKYDTVNWILLGNRPSNPNVFGLIVPDDIYTLLISRPEDVQYITKHQKLARTVIRSIGFNRIILEQP
jgi:hypothetical protein